MSERIDQRARFDYVRYANCWEDADILCKAMEAGPGKRYISVASAGDNSLALLAEGAEVVAADISLAQLACVELRCAGFAHLEHEELLAFLGVCEASNRWSTYQGLRKDLSPAARSFWDDRRLDIEAGIIFKGKFENYFRLFRERVLPLVHSRKTIRELFISRDPEKRRQFYEQVWNNVRWRLCFRVFFSRWVMGRLGRDPEFFRYVKGSVSERILERARYGLAVLPPDENPYLTFIFTGCFGQALPRYLRPEYHQRIREGLTRLKLHHGSVEDAAALYGASGWDGFNLSDIFEYLDVSTCACIYEKLLKYAHPRARFVYWNMLVPRRRPESVAARVRSMDQLAEELFKQDKAVFYSAFVVEEVAE